MYLNKKFKTRYLAYIFLVPIVFMLTKFIIIKTNNPIVVYKYIYSTEDTLKPEYSYIENIVLSTLEEFNINNSEVYTAKEIIVMLTKTNLLFTDVVHQTNNFSNFKDEIDIIKFEIQEINNRIFSFNIQIRSKNEKDESNLLDKMMTIVKNETDNTIFIDQEKAFERLTNYKNTIELNINNNINKVVDKETLIKKINMTLERISNRNVGILFKNKYVLKDNIEKKKITLYDAFFTLLIALIIINFSEMLHYRFKNISKKK